MPSAEPSVGSVPAHSSKGGLVGSDSSAWKSEGFATSFIRLSGIPQFAPEPDHTLPHLGLPNPPQLSPTLLHPRCPAHAPPSLLHAFVPAPCGRAFCTCLPPAPTGPRGRPATVACYQDSSLSPHLCPTLIQFNSQLHPPVPSSSSSTSDLLSDSRLSASMRRRWPLKVDRLADRLCSSPMSAAGRAEKVQID